MRPFPAMLWISLLFGSLPVVAATTQTAQSPTEDSAFVSAQAQTDPQQRFEALQRFLFQYPASSHKRGAQQLLLDTCLFSFPTRTAAIHQVADALVTSATPGIERWTEEARLADRLSEAGPNGADMADAAHWASDAVSSLTEPAYKRDILHLQMRYKLPALAPRQLQSQFAHDRAAALASLANVQLRQGQTAQAASHLAEAFHLDPLSPEVNQLRGTVALRRGDEAAALVDLLRASALGPLPSTARTTEVDLFRKLQHADEQTLDERVDAAYAALYPAPFHLAKRHMETGGHPALLELFTGSDCAPCAGPDLAIDSLLDTYDRHDLIALEFDEHVPRPDPLATPEGAARASFYGVTATPTALLDGQPLEILGATRQDVQNVVVGFADALEAQASRPSGLQITLTTAADPTGTILAHVRLAQTPVPAKELADATGDTSLHALQRAELYIALVQDDLRYPGLNGIRMHRMVVRAMQHGPATLYLNTASGPSAAFDLAAIEKAQGAYLDEYEQHNERYGAIHFASKAFPLQPGHLAVVVWVQDPATKQVLQSAFAELAHP